MDPGTMMMIASLITAGGGALTGGKARQGSTYSKGAQKSIDDIFQDIKSMRGQGQQDITQNQGYQEGQNWLHSMFNDPDFFKNFEAPLQRQFEEQTVPDLANRFASQGSGGSLGSTGFRNQLAREGSNLHTNIAALRGGMQQQGVGQQLQYAQQPINNLNSMYQNALQPTQNQYQPPSPGIGAFAGPLMSGANAYFGAGGGQNSNAGQSPSTYQYPLTGGYDQAFRMSGVQ